MNRHLLTDSPGVGESESSQPSSYKQQSHGPLFVIFSIWVISLPFQRYSVVSTFSVDNLLAPFLCLAAPFLPRLRNTFGSSQRIKVFTGLIILYCLFWLASILPVLSINQVLLQRGWLGLRDSFYLFAVVLFIRDRGSFKQIKSLLIIVTMIAAVTSLLDSLGWIHLPIQRYEASRVDISWLPKAIGLLSSYGDVAMLYGFTVVVLVSHSKNELAFGLGGRLGKLLVWLSLLAGIAGSQSRNVVITSVIALGAYRTFRALSGAQASTRFVVTGMLLALAISILGAMVAFGGDIAHMIGSWGGTNAAETANWRLETYGEALSLIAQHPFTGITGDIYNKWGYLADVLHNAWLKTFLQGGLLRFLALVGLFWLGLKGGYNNLRVGRECARDAALVMSTFVTMIVATQFYGGQSEIMWVMLGTLISFNWVSRDEQQRNSR